MFNIPIGKEIHDFFMFIKIIPVIGPVRTGRTYDFIIELVTVYLLNLSQTFHTKTRSFIRYSLVFSTAKLVVICARHYVKDELAHFLRPFLHDILYFLKNFKINFNIRIL